MLMYCSAFILVVKVRLFGASMSACAQPPHIA